MTEFMNAIDKLDKNAGTMVDVKNYFEYPNSATFSKEWKALSEADKVDLKNGVGKVDKVTGKAAGPLDY